MVTSAEHDTESTFRILTGDDRPASFQLNYRAISPESPLHDASQENHLTDRIIPLIVMAAAILGTPVVFYLLDQFGSR